MKYRAIATRRDLLLLALIVVCLLIPLSLSAQEPGASDDDVNAIAKQLYCPVCENVPLDVCPTAACEQWREEIRLQLGEGWSEQQIIDDFVQRFGDRVVGTPQDPILRTLSLVTPWVMALIALAVGIFTFIRWRSNQRLTTGSASTSGNSTPGNTSGSADDHYRAQLESDLKARS